MAARKQEDAVSETEKAADPMAAPEGVEAPAEAQASTADDEAVPESDEAAAEASDQEGDVDASEAEADLEDEAVDPDAISAAPPRNHESLVSQFAMKWEEVKAFSAHLTGDLDGELGEVLALVRKYEG